MNLELSTFLLKALQEIPGDLDTVFVNTVVRDAARKNDKRPAFIGHYAPDEWVVNLLGNPKLRDMYVSVRIPIEFIQKEREKWEKAKEQEKAAANPTSADPTGDHAEST